MSDISYQINKKASQITEIISRHRDDVPQENLSELAILYFEIAPLYHKMNMLKESLTSYMGAGITFLDLKKYNESAQSFAEAGYIMAQLTFYCGTQKAANEIKEGLAAQMEATQKQQLNSESSSN